MVWTKAKMLKGSALANVFLLDWIGNVRKAMNLEVDYDPTRQYPLQGKGSDSLGKFCIFGNAAEELRSDKDGSFLKAGFIKEYNWHTDGRDRQIPEDIWYLVYSGGVRKCAQMEGKWQFPAKMSSNVYQGDFELNCGTFFDAMMLNEFEIQSE
jgi:hypothetical protein